MLKIASKYEFFGHMGFSAVLTIFRKMHVHQPNNLASGNYRGMFPLLL
jgi:hypothetical protein